MIPTASLSLLSVIASAVLAVAGWGSPLAVAHLAFAVGIVPLIFAAMMHFVPVLTRTGDVDPRMMRLPHAAQAFGVIAALWRRFDAGELDRCKFQKLLRRAGGAEAHDET